ncbi:MAG: hypothetical protein QNJ19_01500 [Woeseiaceae bacterium]|nr:hypothetical protein [Woeseiaceae bacterium]
MRSPVVKALPLFVMLAAQPQAVADDQSPEDIVTEALQQVEWNPGTSWAYTQTGFEDETLIVSRFDPSEPKGNRWTLVAVDNRPPTLEEIEAFEEDKQYDQDIPEDDSDVPDMIELKSLALASEDADSWIFSFQPVMDSAEAEFADKLIGELKVSKASGALQYVDVHNSGPIRPAFGVKIKTMHMRFDFAPAQPNGPQVISEISAKVKGGAYLLVSFDEMESTRFSDFRYVGDQSNPPRASGDSSL